jgi:hypothetical protein
MGAQANASPFPRAIGIVELMENIFRPIHDFTLKKTYRAGA